MSVITNGEFAVIVIPECRATSLMMWAEKNKLTITRDIEESWHYYIPYRNPYDRIIRGLGADFHELMYDSGLANLNREKWVDVEPRAMKFINEWIDNHTRLPIQKNYCHCSYFSAYTYPNDKKSQVHVFDISQIDRLPIVLNNKYGTSLTTTIPDLPPNFYEHTVPYWVIDQLVKTNPKLAEMVDRYIEYDSQYTIGNKLTVGDLLVDSQIPQPAFVPDVKWSIFPSLD